LISDIQVSLEGSWVEKGGAYILDAGDPIRTGQDGGRYRFIGWDDETLPASPSATIKDLQSPKTVKAIWVHEYPVVIEMPNQIITEWVESGQLFQYTAPQIIELGPGRRMVFIDWDSETSNTDYLTAAVRVDGPKYIKPEYMEEVLVRPIFIGSDGVEVSALATLSLQGRQWVLESGGEYWMPSGLYRIDEIIFRDVDVKSSEYLRLSEPGNQEILVDMYNVEVGVVDFLGMPFSWASLTLSNPYTVEAETHLDGLGRAGVERLTGYADQGVVRVGPLAYGFGLNPHQEKIRIVLPLSPTSMLLLVFASVYVFLVVRSRLNR
jgi:hypothetical protein